MNAYGAWHEDEIQLLTNPSKAYLGATFYLTKDAKYDFVIVVYAGHGGWERTTILEINPKGETVKENELKGLATRKILPSTVAVQPAPSRTSSTKPN